MIRSRPRRMIVLAMLWLLAGAVTALPSDRRQPITIQSDRAERDDQQGTTTYEGSVVMEQGSMRIEADQVIIYDRDNKVTTIVAVGKPARYRQTPSVGSEPVIASASRLEYRLSEQSLHLIENASLVQGGSSLTGKRIDYDVRQAVVKAGGDDLNESERVRMVIPPKALESADRDNENKETADE